MEIKLFYLGYFESEYKGQTYKVYRFIDPSSLTIIYGSNLNANLKENTIVQCKIGIKRNKLVVEEII